MSYLEAKTANNLFIPEGYCKPGAKINYLSDEIANDQIEDVWFGIVRSASNFYLIFQEDSKSIDFFDRKLQCIESQTIPGTNKIGMPNPDLLEPGLPVLITVTKLEQFQLQRKGQPNRVEERFIQNWHRALILTRIDKTQGKYSEIFFHVFLIDSGEKITVPIIHVRYLRIDLLDEMPAQAILAQFYGTQNWLSQQNQALKIQSDKKFVQWTEDVIDLPKFAKFMTKAYDKDTGLFKWEVLIGPVVMTHYNIYRFQPIFNLIEGRNPTDAELRERMKKSKIIEYSPELLSQWKFEFSKLIDYNLFYRK